VRNEKFIEIGSANSRSGKGESEKKGNTDHENACVMVWKAIPYMERRNSGGVRKFLHNIGRRGLDEESGQLREHKEVAIYQGLGKKISQGRRAWKFRIMETGRRNWEIH